MSKILPVEDDLVLSATSTPPNLTLSRKALILLVGVPLLCQLAFFGAVAMLLYQAESAKANEAHARSVIQHANSLLRLSLELGTTTVMYRYGQNSDARSKFRTLEQQLQAEGNALKDLVAGHPDEEQRTRDLQEAIALTLKNFRGVVVEPDDKERASVVQIARGTSDIFASTDRLIAQQKTLQHSEIDAAQSYQNKLNILLIAGITFNFVVACLVAALFTRSTVSRLDILMSNVVRIAGRQPLPRAVEGVDEIAHLDRFFHQMATSLDEATRKERAAVQNAVDVICSTDADGKVLAINPACRTSWGYSPNDLVGRRLSQIVQLDDVERIQSMIEQSIATKHNLTFENRIRCKDGSFLDTLWSVHWSQEEKSLFCMASDITERKRLDAARSEFVALVRDGLKTPLTSIHECLKLLADSAKLSESGIKGITMAEDNAERLIALVNDLLDIERMESGKLELRISPCTVARIIERSVRSVAGVSQLRRVQIETQEIGEIQFEGDEDRLVQVLVNILSNAIKFSAKNSRIIVTANEGPDWVEISVKDFGRGVPLEMRETIFERFKQIHPSDDRIRGGKGLGLAICKAIVEQHGGSIGVRDNYDDEKQCGSDFWFRLGKKFS